MSPIYMSKPHTHSCTHSYYFLLPLIPLYLSDHLFCSLALFLSFIKAMSKFDKSQVIVLFLLALLLVFTPLLPSSLRPAYLYFIFNVLIIALGAEAGLLSAFPKPLEDRKQPVSGAQRPVMPPEVITEEREEASSITSGSAVAEHEEKKPKVVVEDSVPETIVGVTKVDKVRKCTSMPSLLLAGGEADTEVMEEELEAEDEIGGVTGQELFVKAEAFIGNFYKQLKMQREESWIY